MNLTRYALSTSSSFEEFEFISEGPNGRILKAILFSHMAGDYYNLGFGDRNALTGAVDDSVVSNNGDRDKVLATVAFTVVEFMATHPGAKVIAIGLTPVHARLYQMGVTQNWADIEPRVTVKGYANDGWEPFLPNKNYRALLVESKE